MTQNSPQETRRRRAEENFTITYDGAAVDGGRMSVQQLAPALIALSRAVEAAQQVAEPLGSLPALDIRAMRDGSFAVDLVVYDSGVVQAALNLLAGREATAIVNLAELVGITFGGFKLVRWLSRRRIRRQEALPNGMVRITFDDGQTITIPSDSLRLAADKPFREAARDVVAPVAGEGVDTVALSSDREPESVVVSKEDLPGFDVPPALEEELVDNEREVVLRPVSVAFTEGNKWRVSDGDATFWTSVSDQNFLERVESGVEVFSKSDILRARLRTRSFRDVDGELRTERDIVEVMSHVPGPRDVPLPFEQDPPDDEWEIPGRDDGYDAGWDEPQGASEDEADS